MGLRFPQSGLGSGGGERTAHTHEFTCLRYTQFYTQPMTVILIRNPGGEQDFDGTLASTNTDASTPHT